MAVDYINMIKKMVAGGKKTSRLIFTRFFEICIIK